jgi:pyridinium-3,5-biscarboxylic acid mononucleotide sulfurtransferase
MSPDLLLSIEDLRLRIARLGPMVIGFSGGVDSTLLLKVGVDVLGPGAVAVTTVSPSLPASEREEAISLARSLGAIHRLVESEEMEDPRYRENSERRCYFCKAELFRILRRAADELGYPVIAYGAQKDDLREIRPGLAAAQEMGARAPLLEAGLGKEEIRAISRFLGLPTWDKPAMACLASRIPHGTPISADDLSKVEEAERRVRAHGFNLFRVRARGSEARLEIALDEMHRLHDPELRRRLQADLLSSGFASVIFDPDGYRPGGGATFAAETAKRG